MRAPNERRASWPRVGVGWLLFAYALTATAAEAAVYTSGCAAPTACTFQELLGGGSITAGGQRFASFAIEADPGTMNWNDVIVTGRDDMGLSPGPGLDFATNNEATTSGTDCIDLQFSYTVKPVIPQWQPVANELVMGTNQLVGSGRIEVDEALFDVSRRAIGDKTIGSDDAFDENRVFDSIEFPPQPDGLLVSNSIVIEGGNPGDFAALGDFVQRFGLHPVPEPSFAPLLASGAGLIALLGHHRSRHRHATTMARHRAQKTGIEETPGVENAITNESGESKE